MMKYYFHRFPAKIMLLLVETDPFVSHRNGCWFFCRSMCDSLAMRLWLCRPLALFPKYVPTAAGARNAGARCMSNATCKCTSLWSFHGGWDAWPCIYSLLGLWFVEIKVANCCLVWNHYIALGFSMGPAVQRVGKHMAVLVHALDLEYQDQ